MPRKPLIGLTADSIMVRDIMPGAVVYNCYSEAVVGGAGGLPWIIPPLGPALDFEALLDRVDGMVFTGARSNVEPHHYGHEPARQDDINDPARDGTTLPLLPMVLERDIPLLCVCRGFQELNVVLGGTLHQEVHKIPETMCHIPPDDAPPDEKFAPAHEITIEEGGVLSRIAPRKSFQVNSVHGQGIDELAAGLRVEAQAPDGIIEAVSVRDREAFNLGLQFHPEWKYAEHPLYRAIWQAFGEACRG